MVFKNNFSFRNGVKTGEKTRGAIFKMELLFIVTRKKKKKKKKKKEEETTAKDKDKLKEREIKSKQEVVLL